MQFKDLRKNYIEQGKSLQNLTNREILQMYRASKEISFTVFLTKMEDYFETHSQEGLSSEPSVFGTEE